MKISENWLREWVNPTLTQTALADLLTMSGLEIEGIHAASGTFSNVVVAEVVDIEKHPEADRLHVCKVNVGKAELLSIVCGASNVVKGMKTAAALSGAKLPNNVTIKITKLRGIQSEGMLCTAAELGLAETSDGLLVLPNDAVCGTALWDYLALSDFVIEVAITPNRGDCLSILGMAYEISALTGAALLKQTHKKISPTIKDQLPIQLELSDACPRYAGRVIRNVRADSPSPVWLQERLRRSGVRSISVIVDIMNYVMLELGQPMHAFDLSKLAESIHVRAAKNNETLSLLDGQKVKLKEGTLLIADKDKPLAIAGVMGGLESGVTLLTTDIFLESAFFVPETIMQSCRHYGLGSESSYRFERGVDPELAIKAIERATELVLELAGGEAGPVHCVEQKDKIPQEKSIHLNFLQIEKILGLPIEKNTIEQILQQLQFSLKQTPDGWHVTVPARRFDIVAPIDLIEEVARVYGYEKIPLRMPHAVLQFSPQAETSLSITTIRQALCNQGYNEVVTYSFVDEKLQKLFDPDAELLKLSNPITSDMEVMRSSLWPGLINTLKYNQNLQQPRVRIFETGLRFVRSKKGLLQEWVLSGLISGATFPEQWGIPTRSVDFFDLKGDIEELLVLTKETEQFIFKSIAHPALHPGQTAGLYKNNNLIGIMGCLHPALLEQIDVTGNVFLFELQLDGLKQAKIPQYVEISKFPAIRRDLAILVDRTIPAQVIQDTIKEVAGGLLQDVNVFDIYEGKGIVPTQKSIALSLILQHSSRTLVDEEVVDLMGQIISALKNKFAAELKGLIWH